LSFLNTPEVPAGKRGFVRARGALLEFEDGTPARFWGTNLTAGALFGTSKEAARTQAHRLSELGFNLVRIHHHDSEWVDPNIFGGRNARDTSNLDPSMLDKLDWWIKCLRDEGIFVWLDLHVGRRVKAADGIDGFEEIRQGRSTAALNGYNYVNTSIREAMKRFNESYLDHRNSYTGLRFKDDPAIVAVLITNENDLTHHFGNSLLPDKGVPWHSQIYLREADNFADQHGLPRDRVWRAWEDGPSKIFLNDLEQRFDLDMIAHLHALGVESAIVTTSSWGLNPLSSLPALTAGDIIDVHSYGGEGELRSNPLFTANLVNWIAAAHVAGKPLSASEWGLDRQGTLAADRQDIPLYVAATASLQGWDAVMFYAYSQEALNGTESTPSVYQAYNDPALLASMPAAALLYRQGHVRESATSYVFAPDEHMLFDRTLSPATSVALRTASERGKLLIALPRSPELPWLRQSIAPRGANMLRDPQATQIAAGASHIVSDSGELERDWNRGTFIIDTPRTQAAMGRIGGTTITLPDVQLAIATGDALAAIQSLDAKPIGSSRELMISVGTRSEPSPGHSPPFRSDPVQGKIFIHAPPGLSLTAWDAGLEGMRTVCAAYRSGRYEVVLDPSLTDSRLLLSPRIAGQSAQCDPLHNSPARSRNPR
jgi:hypothetical protein